jgi:hypothetical protein
MNARVLVADFSRRDIRIIPDGDGLIVEPASMLTEADRQAIRAHKGELLTLLTAQLTKATTTSGATTNSADEALAILARLKGYILPSGRMLAARVIVERLRPLLATPQLEFAESLAALQKVEAELLTLGGRYDQKLAGAVELVTTEIPDARLVEVRKLQ